MAKVGDLVRFLNSVGGGKIVKITGNIAHVEDEDGFETPVLLREIVVVGEAADETVRDSKVKTFSSAGKKDETKHKETVADIKPSVKASAARMDAVPEPVIETAEGEKLNVVIAFEPDNIKEISSTEISTYLVNDSNYYIYFTYSCRGAVSEEWTLHYAGMVEPNIQLYIESVDRSNLSEMDRIKVQFIAFKEDRAFKAKPAVSVEHSLDTTKFFKMHSFKDNVYFDNPVIALDIVTDDVPFKHHPVDKSKFEQNAIKEKKRADRPVRKKPVVKKTERRNNDIIEVDLHINELLDNTNGLSSADMLNLQIDEFRRVMDENLRNVGQKIVFIHGKGEGVLRNAIAKELNYRYKGHLVQDASFREYGFGATQVTIRKVSSEK